MVKKSASFVLASLRAQRTARSTPRPSLAVAALDGLFDHPV